MTWETEPPTMPVAGWYADPQQQWMWRWWDGVQWTEVRSPMGWSPPPRDPHSFSAWFEDSTGAVKLAVRRVGLFVFGAQLVCFALIGLVFFAAFRSPEAREIRDIIDFDRVFEGNESHVEVTDAEWRRVGDLLGDLLRTWAPALVLLAVLLVLVAVWSLTVAARAVEHPTASTTALVGGATRRVPVVAASSLLLMMMFTAVVLVPLVPMFVAIAADLGPAGIAPTAVVGVVAATVLACWIGGRVSLALVGAALGGHGLGIRRSWELTRGHYWGVVGRLVVASIIASVVTAPLSFVSSFAFAIGFVFIVVWTLLIQAVSSTASVLVTVPAQTVLWQHLSEELDASD